MNKIITVWGNSEYGCELAYEIAKKTEHEVLLIDIDLLSPTADLYLKVNKEHEKNKNSGTGLEMLMEWANRNYLKPNIIKSAAVKREEVKNLYIITGSYEVENFEYYTRDNLREIIEKAQQNFEITILLVNKYLYDAYTAISLVNSHINIAAIEANAAELREFNKYLVFLKNKQNLDYSKTLFAAWEYRPELHYTLQEFKELTNNFLGAISYSKSRVACRSNKTCYSKVMEKQVKKEYEKMIVKLGFTPKLTLKERISSWVHGEETEGGTI